MIGLRNVTHAAPTPRGLRNVLSGATFVFPRECVALIGAEPAARRAIIDLLTASVPPASGKISWAGRVSWPIGRVLQFRSQLSGFETVDFFASLYNLDARKLVRFMGEFPELGVSLKSRTAGWPAGASLKFSYILALTVDFGIYVCDGTMWVPSEPAFNEIWQQRFKARIEGRTAVIASVRPQSLEYFCSRAVVAEEGGLRLIDDLARGLSAYPQRPEPVENPRSMASVEQDDDSD
jgi:capsular polysaccharide transport system ATP-binding protein